MKKMLSIIVVCVCCLFAIALFANADTLPSPYETSQSWPSEIILKECTLYRTNDWLPLMTIPENTYAIPVGKIYKNDGSIWYEVRIPSLNRRGVVSADMARVAPVPQSSPNPTRFQTMGFDAKKWIKEFQSLWTDNNLRFVFFTDIDNNDPEYIRHIWGATDDYLNMSIVEYENEILVDFVLKYGNISIRHLQDYLSCIGKALALTISMHDENITFFNLVNITNFIDGELLSFISTPYISNDSVDVIDNVGICISYDAETVSFYIMCFLKK